MVLLFKQVIPESKECHAAKFQKPLIYHNQFEFEFEIHSFYIYRDIMSKA